MPVLLFLFVLIPLQTIVVQPSVSFEEAVLSITGCDDISQVNGEILERLEHLCSHPVNINNSARSVLLSSGLFTDYQVAALVDYIQRNGAVLSPLELSAVDGFSRQTACNLSLFVSFDEKADTKKGPGFESTAGIAGRFSGNGLESRIGAKVAVAAGLGSGELKFGAAARTVWAASPVFPENAAWDFAWQRSGKSGRFCLADVIAGWYNARFGQGLCTWSGTVIESYSSVSALMKRPQGITPYAGYAPDGTKFGAAFSMRGRHLTASAYCNLGTSLQALVLSGQCGKAIGNLLPDSEYGMNLSWNHRSGTVGLTSSLSPFNKAATGLYAVSADFQQTISGTVIYGECCLKPSSGQPSSGQLSSGQPSSDKLASVRTVPVLSTVTGVRFTAGYFDAGLRCGYLPEEHNCTFASNYASASGFHCATLALSASYYEKASGRTPGGSCQLKILGTYKYAGSDRISVVTRLSGRLRALTIYADPDAKYVSGWSDVRLDFREDINADLDPWHLCLRFNVLKCVNHSMLGYMECGYKALSGIFQSYLQTGAFRIDNWDDRIYVYQRGAPGSFNVTAKYGRGVWVSLYSCLKLPRAVKFYLTMSWEAYPWARPEDTRKNPSLSANFQTCISLYPRKGRQNGIR